MRGAIRILEGRQALAAGDAGWHRIVRDGLQTERGMRAAWWVRRAIRTLESGGEAPPDEVSEAAAIDVRLGVVATTF